jgi:hypothetical protein
LAGIGSGQRHAESWKIGKSEKILFLHEPFGLDAAHLTWGSGGVQSSLAADDPTHCRIMAQTFGVVQVLVSREAAEG